MLLCHFQQISHRQYHLYGVSVSVTSTWLRNAMDSVTSTGSVLDSITSLCIGVMQSITSTWVSVGQCHLCLSWCWTVSPGLGSVLYSVTST